MVNRRISPSRPAAARRSGPPAPADRRRPRWSPRGPRGGAAPADDDALGLVGRARAGKVAERAQHVADMLVRERQVALAAVIERVGGGEPAGDREAGAILGERGDERAARLEQRADALVGEP